MKQTIGCGTRKGNLYYLDLKATTSDKLSQALAMKECNVDRSQAEIFLVYLRRLIFLVFIVMYVN